MIPEDVSGDAGADGRIGISAEPPGFLKRLFSVPKNVRRTAAAGDVVVPVIGARDGWGGIRQARLMLRLRLWSGLQLQSVHAASRDKDNSHNGLLALFCVLSRKLLLPLVGMRGRLARIPRVGLV